jgi:hypothetical protein
MDKKAVSPGFDMTMRTALKGEQLFCRLVYSLRRMFRAPVEFFRKIPYSNSACGGGVSVWSQCCKNPQGSA